MSRCNCAAAPLGPGCRRRRSGSRPSRRLPQVDVGEGVEEAIGLETHYIVARAADNREMQFAGIDQPLVLFDHRNVIPGAQVDVQICIGE